MAQRITDADRRDWTDIELSALAAFRRANGPRWKSKLLDLYQSGRDDDQPNGPTLRQIRNRQGPSRVHALPKATLDAAEQRPLPLTDKEA